MKYLTILLIAMCLTFQAQSQNEIHLLNSDSTLTFKKIRFSKESIRILPMEKGKASISFSNKEIYYVNMKGIHYGPAAKGYFKVKDVLFQNEISKQAALDACRNYTNYKSAATGTFCTTFFTGPILGLIPAISTSSTPPKLSNLNIPDTKLKDVESYITSYRMQAKNMKSSRVWNNYASGIIYAILISVTANLIIIMSSAG